MSAARAFDRVYGVDFSGAALAGRFIWIAEVAPASRPALLSLDCLESLCGSPDRAVALQWLVRRVGDSTDALWAMDLPFGLPVEIIGRRSWSGQRSMVRRFAGTAADFGRHCLAEARRLGLPNHVRRTTDKRVKTPFDGYHYRIVYQTFHGIRDVLCPIAADGTTAILPFDYPKLSSARRLLVEACPSSTLKRWGAPHHHYKQPTGGPLTRLRRLTRRRILERLAEAMDIPPAARARMMRNPGGDALDAAIAAAGAIEAWRAADHAAIAADPRIVREGWIYA